METLQSLQRKVDTTRSLRSVVKTMKALAAVNIRQYERATESLADYSRAVERGLQALLQQRPGGMPAARAAGHRSVGAVVFGSDQGMCGQLNDRIAQHALETLAEHPGDPSGRRVLAVGVRVASRLEDGGLALRETLTVPGSAEAITPQVQKVLVHLRDWRREHGVEEILLFHCEHRSGATYRPIDTRMLPLDREWLDRLAGRDWPTNQLPRMEMDHDRLFSALVREYLFGSLFRAFAESLASENASRLASMQGAERNIKERLDQLTKNFHQRRQMAITEELLDIVTGFEALRK